METTFIVDPPSVRVIKLNKNTLVTKLPAQIYTVAFHPMMGFSLTINKDSLQLPEKIYGDADTRTDKCIQTYKDRTASTGILLTGDKGTGKTLQMALLANRVIEELDLPVLLIKEPYAGSQFTSFIEDIGECCLVFDEFGKMYGNKRHGPDSDEVPQTSLLSLMDGVDKTKRLIILTENDKWDINEFMLNRPSRIYYHFEYDKLPEDSIKDYCTDKLVNNTITKEIVDLARKSEIFSFDILQSIVEEHLRFGTSVEELIPELNIDVKEKDLKLQIIKIILRNTNEELKIKGSPIINFNGYDFHFTAYQAESQKVKRKVKTTDTTKIGINLNEHPDVVGIHMDNSELAYESGDSAIYENEYYTIVTKEIKTQQSNYASYL